jgi:hypothetical protein
MKKLSGQFASLARFEEYASQTQVRKVTIGNNGLREVAQIRNPLLSCVLRHSISVHPQTDTQFVRPSQLHSDLLTGLLHQDLPNIFLHIQRVLHPSPIPKFFI